MTPFSIFLHSIAPRINQPINQGINRRGQEFEVWLVIGVIVVLTQGYLILSAKQTPEAINGNVGETSQIIGDLSSGVDEIQLYIGQAALLSQQQAMAEFARRGGMETERCGIINGYSLWNTNDKTLTDCIPTPTNSFISLFSTLFPQHLAQYVSHSKKHMSLQHQFDITLTTHNGKTILTGTSPEIIHVPLTDENAKLLAITNVYPSFSISQPPINQEIEELKQGAATILSNCHDAPDPFACSQAQAYTINTKPHQKLLWKTGPCAGDLATPNQRIIQFCVQAPRKVLTAKAGGTLSFYPMLYKFALTITKYAPLTITAFSANHVPSTGIPTERGGLGISPGAPLSYSGMFTTPELKDLTVNLCFTNQPQTICKSVATEQWDLESYVTRNSIIISGIIQPPLPPPFTLTFVIEQGTNKESTAGINVVQVLPVSPTIPLSSSEASSITP